MSAIKLLVGCSSNSIHPVDKRIKYAHTNKQTDRQTVRQPVRQTDRQTNNHDWEKSMKTKQEAAVCYRDLKQWG